MSQITQKYVGGATNIKIKNTYPHYRARLLTKGTTTIRFVKNDDREKNDKDLSKKSTATNRA